MLLRIGVLASVIAFITGGCSIHPLPDDVTHVSTPDIVRNVRCEARDAIRGKIIAVLGQVEGDPAATKYAQLLHDDPTLWQKFNKLKFSSVVTIGLAKYEQSAVAYNFSLDMTEVNNLDPTIDLTNPVRLGTFTSSVMGGADRTRENARTFTITDKWDNLITTLDETYCAKFAHVDNYMYPITGRIGIDEMIDTFVDLAQFDNLSGASSGKPPTMADDLKFTTKLSIGGTPKVVFTPFSKGLSVADASLATSFSRQDVHQVTVGLSLPLPPGAGATGKNKPSQLLITARGGAAELAAAQAVEQSITRYDLARRSPIIVSP
jgi:hypothetical protein